MSVIISCKKIFSRSIFCFHTLVEMLSSQQKDDVDVAGIVSGTVLSFIILTLVTVASLLLLLKAITRLHQKKQIQMRQRDILAM